MLVLLSLKQTNHTRDYLIGIDIDALAEIDLGDGKKQTVQQTLNMYLQKVVSTVLLLLAEILIMLKNHFKRLKEIVIN
jgi:hypothetical protein